MTIPSRLQTYLEQHGTRYEVCTHQHSRTSVQTARTAHVPAHQLAKAVVVEDDDGCVMAVLPADRMVQLGDLARMLGRRRLRLAEKRRVVEMFGDCQPGAVPTLGMAWGLETVVDDELEASPSVYIECGDHECLLHLTHDAFHALMRTARHGQFCAESLH